MMDDEKKSVGKTAKGKQPTAILLDGTLRFDEPRKVIQTVINFESLNFPREVRCCLAEAFWRHIGIRPARSILTSWSYIKIYNRFQTETDLVKKISDQNGIMLVRYIEWLNRQTRNDGRGWSKATMFAAYSTVRSLLQWIERCKPGLLPKIEYPFNPFPWRNRDSLPRRKMAPSLIRSVIKACEHEIANLRSFQERMHVKATVGEIPFTRGREISQLSSPSGKDILPYYLLITIHAAGNPDAITALRRDCLQPIPLLEDREALVWYKARANSYQRRTFKTVDKYEPPFLIKELLAWNAALISQAPFELKDRLFLYKTPRGITALTTSAIKHSLKKFCCKHSLQLFSLSSIRPGVLSSFYRASGDLRKVKAAANHRNLSTTVRYVQNSEVLTQNQLRISELQTAFLAHIESKVKNVPESLMETSAFNKVPTGDAVSMFGFDCKDPYAGMAPGTHKGELCESFLGCFTCPNAVIKSDPVTVARLLQAREHLRLAANKIHPMRWHALYHPQLKILEEDILSKFSSKEIEAAESYVHKLSPLLELR